MSGSRFPTRTHALDSLESIPNRFGDFYFPTKIKIFGNPRKSLKILENPWFGPISAIYPGWMLVSSREEWEKLEKSENLMLGGAVGAPEARNKLGMLVVMSLQLSVAIGGT